MRFTLKAALTAALFALPGANAFATTITIATVNNNDMVVMQKLSKTWEKDTGNHIKWVVLQENVLRQRVTTDIATHGGQFDIVTIGAYETPIWAKRGWLVKLNDFPASYDYNDLLPPVRQALTVDGAMYAAPFYAESSFTMYRKDLFKKAGLTMPEQPTYAQIEQFADKLTDKSKQQYGICLRGKPGWGENMAFLGTLVNTYGGRWFNMKWEPQLTSKPWENAINFYVDLMKKDGPPGASSDGFNEAEALFATGHCAIWIDSTVAAGMLDDPKQSQVAGEVGFAKAPVAVTDKGAAWQWIWSLAIPSSSKHQKTAKEFIAWATSQKYIDLVGNTEGWVVAPPGTRMSTYQNPNYLKAAPFAKQVLAALESANPHDATLKPVPYTGIQFVTIPPFQQIGTTVGQDIAGALSGSTSVSAALNSAQQSTTSAMQQAGYLK
ncbi:ABC transporter substrate-binding protein [Acidocella aminolytica]|uniref:Transporter n=1 Tax=Acidocella aminolytica 101 = DSM 11237 TaxID=1120923 RepID=A0A0D6PMA2_9PROT|nr:sugar ABC transporter substrate-binding protein [Acidocella aminolytica]GAN81929.1 transporter [Acidocella aminolytica 101 = DSM 11237]GBQ38179.1 periplasmic mannitol/sorbitol binding protein [Acidocella aminolytica 101 = DSM 11237]SHE76880.1 sorbitol/mannitol transport system substrate-binding protein [Acidocella aminolytica 101 = DSM 11237]